MINELNELIDEVGKLRKTMSDLNRNLPEFIRVLSKMEMIREMKMDDKHRIQTMMEQDEIEAVRPL